jgi:spermidine synthase
VERTEGEFRLVVDGAVQSVGVGADETPHGYWPALLPLHRPGSTVVLGLGAGTVAQLLLRRWPDVSITGVDDDAEILLLAQQQFGLAATGVAAVHRDARQYARECSRRFDLVIVDLFRGEMIASFTSERSFIRHVRQLARPGGVVVWNLHRDRRGAALRRRVGAGLVAQRRILAGLNLVLHFRRRSRRPRQQPGAPTRSLDLQT